ncbi:MAG: multidrug efflux SMR transporter [Thermoleophilia bacterium]|nr:multidrug efflux SMR transporter [Thermoleophilia bacterium]
MVWLAVIVAGLLEVGFAVCLKASDNFTRPLPSVGFVAFAAASFGLLSWALARGVPIGSAYAAWTGIGAAGTALLGMTAFGDPATLARGMAIALIIGGVVLLNVSSAGAA